MADEDGAGEGGGMIGKAALLITIAALAVLVAALDEPPASHPALVVTINGEF